MAWDTHRIHGILRSGAGWRRIGHTKHLGTSVTSPQGLLEPLAALATPDAGSHAAAAFDSRRPARERAAAASRGVDQRRRPTYERGARDG